MAIPKDLKNELLVEAKHACVICGASDVQIHHIDGNKKNNNESNLIVLCLKHHHEAEKSKKGKGLAANLKPEQLLLYKRRQRQGVLYHIPIPPQPYFAHPYPLQANFTGRLAERKELTVWFTKGEEPMFAYVAIGGMGKSALTWYWLQEDIIKAGLAPEGIIWWSFYDREASFDSFLRKSIQYASKSEIDAKEMVSVRDGMDTLYTYLSGNRFLLVLDGVERVLRAYAGLGSPYQGDEVTEDKRQDFRACIDPNVGTFLQWLASGNPKTKTLLTTRLHPRELDEIAGCSRIDLSQMDRTDAVEFFERQGVKGTRAEIESACEPYGYHPLCLRLLSGMIVKDPKFQGDIIGWTRHNPMPELTGTEREHHILELAYNSLDPQKQVLLSKLSAFRNPMAYDSISIFNEFNTQEEFDKTLIELVDRGLLLKDADRSMYDLHPIVRRYCYHRLKGKKTVHSRLREHFATRPQPEKVQSVDDLAPVIELYHHTVKCGRYDDPMDLAYERLHDGLYYGVGAYQTMIDLISALFPDGENALPRLKVASAQTWALAVLANSYSLSGKPRKAVPLFELHNHLVEKEGDMENLATGLGNLAFMAQIPFGELKSAELNMRRGIALSSEIKDEFREAPGHLGLGTLFAYQGKFEDSAKELSKALELSVKQQNLQGQCLVWCYRALRALSMSDAEGALRAAERARELADVEKVERDIVLAEWLLGAAHLAKRDLKEAEKHLDEVLVRDRKINLVELEPDILLELGKLRFAQGRKEDALRLANEALVIADRCEYRLKQVDIHNFLAEFYLEGKDFAKAKEHVEIAKERAACGYKPAMDKAEGLAKRIKRAS